MNCFNQTEYERIITTIVFNYCIVESNDIFTSNMNGEFPKERSILTFQTNKEASLEPFQIFVNVAFT